MAASPLTFARRALSALIGVLVAVAALIGLTAWIGSSIPRNSGWIEPPTGTPGAVEILVGTNGFHTELVLPLATPIKDWRGDFPDPADRIEPSTHVAIGWGEREVFLNTPTWRDLTLRNAVRAMAGSDALLHVSHYVRPAPDADFRPLRLSAAQYARLVAQVEKAVLPSGHRRAYPGYSDHDVFYDAPGAYDWRQTCNQWTSDTLAAAGVKTGWWTPFAGGVMKWVERP